MAVAPQWRGIRRRLASANTPLLLAGVGLVLTGATGAALGIGGVSAKRLPSTTAQVAVMLAGLALIGAAFVVGVELAEEPSTEALADRLAEAVLAQWSRAAADRRLETPAPIAVRWRRSALPVAGPVREAVGAAGEPPRFAPLPGIARATGVRLRSGRLRDLHAVYGGLQSGRVVLLGSPGAGKSGALILLLLDALRHRQQAAETDREAVPVPVLLTLRDWDPTRQRVEDWFAGRLAHAYPLLGGGRAATERAARLVTEGRLAVFLDGLDEIPAALRSTALEALSDQAAFRVVLASRSDELVMAAAASHLVGAAALELEPVDVAAAVDYLKRTQRDPLPTGWRELLDHLREQPGSAVAQALRSPLTLTLVRDTYHGGEDVRELITVAGSGHADDVENHLLDRVVPAAYGARPGRPPGRYDERTALLALACIAARMGERGTRDLAWWAVRDWVPVGPRKRLTSAAFVLAGAVTGVILLTATRLIAGGVKLAQSEFWHWAIRAAPMGAGVGLVLGLVVGRLERPPRSARLLRVRGLAVRTGVLTGLAAGLAFGAPLGLIFGPSTGLPFGLAFGFACGLLTALALPDPTLGRDLRPLDPVALWRADRASWRRFGLVFGGVFGIATGSAFGFVTWLDTFDASAIDFVYALAFCLAAGLVVGLVVGVAGSASWSSGLAFHQLARRSRTPRRLLRFLEDAHERDVLRVVGSLYQFRHARLADRLAATSDASPSPARARDRTRNGRARHARV